MTDGRGSDPNIIELDDPGTVRQRIAGGVILLLFVVLMAFPFGQSWNGNAATEAATMTPVNHQSVVDLCARWNVPDYLQPLANAAYPSWQWVCRLTQ